MADVNQTLKEIIKEEYKKCIQSPAYFIKKYVKIQHPKRGTVPFALYPYQEETLAQFQQNSKNIILKCRQMGITTLTAAYSLWLMIFFNDKNILVVANKQDVSKEMITKIRFANENLPSWLTVKAIEDNRLSLRLENGSQIKAVSSASDSGRSQALSLLIWDEVALTKDADELWTSLQSALTHGGGNVIFLSTPKGVGNFFHKTWLDAEQGRQPINPIKLHWTLHPEYDQVWRDEQDKLLGHRKAAQECDCSFESSGTTLVDMTTILWYEQSYAKPPAEKRGIDRGLWIWEYPDLNRQYMVTADTARGDGSDYSTCQVIDIESLVQVAEYEGKMTTKEFGSFLVSVASEYNNALLIPERNSYGWATIQSIIDKEYPNLFYTTEDVMYVDASNQYSNKYRGLDKRNKPGFETTAKTRPSMLSKIDMYFKEKSITIYSTRLLEQLKVFAWNGTKVEALKGYNDDLVIPLGIALHVRDTALILNNRRLELTKKTLGMITKTAPPANTSAMNQLPPILISGQQQTNPYNFRVGSHDFDLRELFDKN